MSRLNAKFHVIAQLKVVDVTGEFAVVEEDFLDHVGALDETKCVLRTS